jgi:protein SCO1
MPSQIVRNFYWGVWFWVVFIFAGQGFAKEVLPVLFPAPHFELENQSAEVFSSQRLQGKVWVLDFFYTSCQSECLMMTTRMQNIAGHFKSKASDLMFVSVSTDPKRDTVAAFREYIKKHKIDALNWQFLRSDKAKIVDLAVSGFKLGADRKSATHSQRFVLVDRQGQVRGLFDAGNAEEMKRLESSMESLF